MNAMYPDIPPDVALRAMGNDSMVTHVTAATTLIKGQNNVHVDLPASGTYLITLPPVATCPGESFMFRAIADPGTGTVTINDVAADGALALGTVTLAALNDWCIIKNYGGELWRLLDSEIA